MRYLLLALVFVVGCGEIDITAVKKSTQFCEDKGGLKRINYLLNIEACECVDGSTEIMGSIKLDKENY